MEIRAATEDDLVALCGEVFPEKIRAMVAVDDDEVLAIAGVRYCYPVLCFSNIKPALKRSPKTILRLAYRVLEFVDKCHSPVFAVADENEPTSMNFLAHLGFEHVEGRTFRWPQQQY